MWTRLCARAMAVISRLRAAVAVAVAVCTGAAAPDDSQCRCLPGDRRWDSIDWAQLNASVGGRLLAFVDEMAPCIADIGSTQCNATLSNDTAYWLADQPNGLQNTALFGAWNISKDHSAYVVRAETEEDFKATTKFATSHGPQHRHYKYDAALSGVELFLSPTQFLEEEQRKNGDENKGEGNDETDHDTELG